MRITFNIPEFTRNERNSHCDVLHITPNRVASLNVGKKNYNLIRRAVVKNMDVKNVMSFNRASLLRLPTGLGKVA